MFTAQQLKEIMNAQPFKPFRICLSDGKSYEITNHDMAFVKKNEIEIGLDLDAQGFAEYSTRCALIHITRIEDLKTQKA